MSELYFADRLPDDLPNNPMAWAQAWLNDAQEHRVRRNANSMTVVTVSADHRPTARIVLCKKFVADPGYLVFHTNYRSQKVRQIDNNPRVAAVFHWDGTGRQIRIEGLAVRSPAAESDDYFATRDWGAKLGAWGSDQSEKLGSREALVAQIRARALALGIQLGDDTQSLAGGDLPAIPRPDHWGGMRIWPDTIELWKDGADRIHDRALWTRELVVTSAHDFSASSWVGTRLQP